jgi:FlaA1/EpsC-like NDP-sugar epimerase
VNVVGVDVSVKRIFTETGAKIPFVEARNYRLKGRRRQYIAIIVLNLFALICGCEIALLVHLIGIMWSALLGGSIFFVLCIAHVKMLPRVVYAARLPEIDVAELLERQVVPLKSSKAEKVLRGKIILVTGAAGSIGSELCRQLLNYQPGCVIALDTNETGLFDLLESLRTHPAISRLQATIGDITDAQYMDRLFAQHKPDVIFHAAAYKHVPLLEKHPDQAIRTNVLATHRLCLLAQQHQVPRFVFVSTDKAAEPTSVLGASKRLGEMIIQSLAQAGQGDTCFCAVRFGNVIGSRGSVVPLFTKQIEQGGPVTVTDPQATRYFMTIPEACGLVIYTAALATQGGLYVLDMGEPVKIVDLATKMIRLRGLREEQDISIVYTGLRPGERLHEALVAEGETLVQTAYSKILSVVYQYHLPMLEDIARWMDALEHALKHGGHEQLRAHLFSMIHEYELVPVGQSQDEAKWR